MCTIDPYEGMIARANREIVTGQGVAKMTGEESRVMRTTLKLLRDNRFHMSSTWRCIALRELNLIRSRYVGAGHRVTMFPTPLNVVDSMILYVEKDYNADFANPMQFKGLARRVEEVTV